MKPLSKSMALVGAMSVFLMDSVGFAQNPAAEAPPPPPAVRVRAAPAPAAEVDGVNQAIVNQYAGQFKPVIRAELHLVRTVCSPTEAQRMQIARDADQKLMETATRFAKIQQEMRQGRARTENPGAREVLMEGLGVVLKAHLTPEQWTRYQAEVERRNTYHREVAARNVVVKLDHELSLTGDQRVKILESLSSNWSDLWCQTLDMLQYDQFFPKVPDEYVVPYLSKAQTDAWLGIPKLGGSVFGFGYVGNMLDNQPLEDEAVNNAPKAEPAPAAAPF
jgi:hypothetical protein